MKALSIREPWGWLIASGHKNIENRSWKTNHRGIFLIHETKTTRKDHAAAVDFVRRFNPELAEKIPPFKPHRGGAIIGSAELVDCMSWQEDPPKPWYMGAEWAFRIANARLHEKSTPMAGALRFWDIMW